MSKESDAMQVEVMQVEVMQFEIQCDAMIGGSGCGRRIAPLPKPKAFSNVLRSGRKSSSPCTLL